MNEEYREQYLMHYGVKGMRWGIRRKRKSSNSNVRKKSSDDEAKKKASNSKARKKEKVTAMDDAELQRRLARLRMETELERLTKQQSTAKIDSIVKNLGTVATLTTSAITIYNNMDKIMTIAEKISKKG